MKKYEKNGFPAKDFKGYALQRMFIRVMLPLLIICASLGIFAGNSLDNGPHDESCYDAGVDAQCVTAPGQSSLLSGSVADECIGNGSPLSLDAECGFLITMAVQQSNGDYQICVQANDQVSPQSWTVSNSGMTVATGTQPNECWQLSVGYPSFFIVQTILDENGNVMCTSSTFVFIAVNEECPDNIVSATVENCNLLTTLNIDASNIGTPFVITFDDGSPAQQLWAGPVTHTYAEPGIHNIYLTYPVGEVGYTTCCYPVQVMVPAHCECIADVISVLGVEPCTWEASLFFALGSGYFPIDVDFGDGTQGTYSGPFISHDYPAPGNYYVCYRYEVIPGDILECCEWVTIPGCCLDPYFELDAILPSESCINPKYRVSHGACQGGIVNATHLWEFSDGTV